jgi:hypothetical protein
VNNHRLRTPNEAFFIKIQNFWTWADKLGTYILGHLGYFCTVSPFSIFSINQPLFLYKNKPLYPHPKYLFGIGI